jgi:hypothetical protein
LHELTAVVGTRGVGWRQVLRRGIHAAPFVTGGVSDIGTQPDACKERMNERLRSLAAGLLVGHLVFSWPSNALCWESQQATIVLGGLQDARQRLETGVYRGSGRVHLFKGEQSVVLEMAIFSAFDFASGEFRFERAKKQDAPARGSRVLAETEAAKFIRASDRSVHWLHTNGNEVHVRLVNTAPYTELNPFDVRTVGLVSPNSFHKNITFEEAFDTLSSQSITEVARGTDQVVRMIWVLGSSELPIKREIWFDAQKGYSPIRHEARIRQGGEWSQPLNETESTWEPKQDTWVPTSMVMISRDGVGNLVSKEEYTFDWEVVNAKLPDDIFSVEGLGLAPGTQIVDERLGKPIVVGWIGREIPGTTPEGRKRGSGLYVTFGAAIVLLLISVAALTYYTIIGLAALSCSQWRLRRIKEKGHV